MSHQVEDTAFVIAYYRAQDVEFSKDPYAQLWQNKGAEQIAELFQDQVSPYDGILHCARNRCILEMLEKHAAPEDNSLVINIGAGFSMYPYVLNSKLQHLEIDLPNVASYKREEVRRFIQDGKLPERNVSHRSFNITNKEALAELKAHINTIKSAKRIILLEGLFFFLSSEELEQLLVFCKDVLSTGDILLCESYDRSIEETEVYHRLLQFFGTDFTLQTQKHVTLPHKFYQHIDGFNLIEQSSTYLVSTEQHKIPVSIPEKELLNEHLYVLQKTQSR